MTIMTAMEGVTAPRRPAPIPAETFLPADETPWASRRADGWSAANQRLFLEGLAEGFGVEVACARVGLSAASAYAFRRTAKGAAFALGWRAATLVARDAIAETLLVRALAGQVDTYARADGTMVTRHRYDNRLGMSLLSRLDRQAEASPDADVKAARLVAQEFDAFLDLVARDEGPARAGLFLARRCGGLGGDDAETALDLGPIYALAAADRLVRTGVATAAEVDVADLDPAARAAWTGEQWARAEAAGLVSLAAPRSDSASDSGETAPAPQDSQHSDRTGAAPSDHAVDVTDPFVDDPVWWNYEAGEWRTRFPPPQDFDGDENGDLGHVDYERALTAAEAARIGGGPEHYDDAEMAELTAQRDAWFGAPGAPAAAAAAAPPAACPDRTLPGDAALPQFQSSPGAPDMADTSHDIRTLNGLIATTLDSVDGYQEAAKDSAHGRFTQMFTSRAEERRQVASTLQAEVSRLGGNPEDDGTLLAGAHRVFLDLKSAVTGQDDKAIVDEVERGEDHIKAKFEDAMQDGDLSPETKSAIGAAWGSVKAGHDEMRDLKHSMEG